MRKKAQGDMLDTLGNYYCLTCSSTYFVSIRNVNSAQFCSLVILSRQREAKIYYNFQIHIQETNLTNQKKNTFAYGVTVSC